VSLAYDAILAATGGKTGKIDVACPECGPIAKASSNRVRKVLRVWDDGEFATYNCARCGIKGWAKADGPTKARREERPRIESEPTRDTKAVAAFLWHSAQPIVGSLAEIYLRSRSCFVESGNLRFLPARNEHPPAMIARFGDGPLTGVHITRLRADGKGKAGGDKDKIMLGESMGQPIIVYDNPERTELIVAEGIEDTATLAKVTGWTAWAAGAAVRLAAVIGTASSFERVFLAIDHDNAGLRALARARMVRPDVVPVDFAKMLGLKGRLDANKVMLERGADAVLAGIEWSDAQARLRSGEIGTEAMARIAGRANDVFTRMALEH